MEIKELFAFFESTHQNVKKEDESDIRIMTSNVLHSRAGSPRQVSWSSEERADILSALFLTFLPDFIGLQEVSYEQTPWFTEKLSDVYATPDTPLGDFVNYPYHGVDYIQNHTPIFYNKLKYELIDSRYHVFFNDDIHSYQWALYRVKANPDQKLIHVNMHPHSHGELNIPNFGEMHRELVHLRRLYPTTPLFLTGDYNALYTQQKVIDMFDGLSMTSGMLIAEQSDGVDCWNHPLGSMELAKAHTAIDHVGVTTDLMDVKLHRILFDELIAKASDHCPMFIDVKLK